MRERKINWAIFVPTIIVALILLAAVVEYRAAAVRLALPFILVALVGCIVYYLGVALGFVGSNTPEVSQTEPQEEEEQS